MNVNKIRQMAKTLSINPANVSKIELIRQIQVAEGNFDCYATAIRGECDQLDCIWRSDCLSEAVAAPQDAQ